LFPENADILIYKAYCYIAQFQYDKAIKAYEEVLKINPDDDAIIAYIGWAYFNLQDYDKASEYANKAISIYDENIDALDLLDELEKVKEPEAKKIADFVQENYLYYNKQKDDIDQKSQAFTNKTTVSIGDIENYIDSVKQKDDIFTFVLSGEDYDYYTNINSNNKVELKNIDSNTYYI
ncbi:tetratricopeptide repeat protein, partial [Cutibacterium acnes]